MESFVFVGFSKLMGYKVMIVCMVIVNCLIKEVNIGYKNIIDILIKIIFDWIWWIYYLLLLILKLL